MFGNLALFPIPDVDRTDHMLIFGANPAVSNGSLMSAPGVRDRLRGILGRGGTVVVVDPRRTETAKLATEHVAGPPGGDPYLLLGHAATCCSPRSWWTWARSPGSPTASTRSAALAARLAARARRAGRPASTPRRSRGWRASSPPPRRPWPTAGVGVCQQQTGSLTHWLINVLNAVTGNLDRARRGDVHQPARGRGRWCSSWRRRSAWAAGTARRTSASAACPT